MATEILINDGGAPARILPFMATSAITAGDALTMDSAGKVVPGASGLATGFKEYILGYALTTVSADELCSVITGKGVLLKANADATVLTGKGAHLSTTAGQLAVNTGLGQPHAVCTSGAAAIALKLIVTV